MTEMTVGKYVTVLLDELTLKFKNVYLELKNEGLSKEVCLLP